VNCPCLDPYQRWNLSAYNRSTYAYSSQVDFGYNAKLPVTAIKLSRVQRPANTIMFCEARYGELNMNVSGAQTEFIQIFQPAPYYNGSAGRHMQIRFVNAVYVDGHAKAVGKDEYIDGLAYTP
jgi:prepilin-type processing-associated H-X9-DG protein